MNSHTTQISRLGKRSIESWIETDEALQQVNHQWGIKFEADRDKLKAALEKAHDEGFDLDSLKGEQSILWFPDLGARVVVATTKKESEHNKLEQIDQKIRKHEDSLKKLKAERKALVTKLLVDEQIEMTVKGVQVRYQHYNAS